MNTLIPHRCIRVAQLNTDNEFMCIEEIIKPVRLNIAAAEEYVRKLERYTRTVKEGTRYHVNMCLVI